MLCLKTLPHQIALGFACLTLACASTAAPAEKQQKGPKLVPPPPPSCSRPCNNRPPPTPVAGPRTADFHCGGGQFRAHYPQRCANPH